MYPLEMTNSLLLNMAIEMLDVPMKMVDTSMVLWPFIVDLPPKTDGDFLSCGYNIS